MTEIRDEVITELILEGVDKYIRAWERSIQAIEDYDDAARLLERKLSRLADEFNNNEAELNQLTQEFDKATQESKDFENQTERARKELDRLITEFVQAKEGTDDMRIAIRKAALELDEFKEASEQADKKVDLLGDEIDETKKESKRLGTEIMETKDKIDRFKRATDKAEEEVEELGDEMVRTRGKASNFANIITGTLSHALGSVLYNAAEKVIEVLGRMVEAGAEFTIDAVKSAENLETTLVELDNVVNDNAVSMEDLGKVALKLGQDHTLVNVSAQDAAEGLTVLHKAGLDATTILGPQGYQGILEDNTKVTGVFRHATDLQAASTLDFNGAASAGVLVLKTYGAGISDTTEQAEFVGDAFDYVTRTADSTNTTTEELFAGLARAAPTLSTLGFSLEETIDYLGLMANAEIKGATAGTQLRRMVANLNRDTKKVNTLHQEYGTSLFDVNGELRSLEDVAGTWDTVLNGVGEKTLFVSNRTAEQNEILGEAEKQYGDATDKLLRYNIGLTELSDRELAEVVSEQQRAVVVMDQLNEVGGEYVTITSEMTEEQAANLIQTAAGVHGQNALTVGIGSVVDARIEELRSTGHATEAALLYEKSQGGMISKFDELHIRQENAITLEERIAKVLETSASKREQLNSVLETLKITYGNIFLGALKDSVDTIRKELEPLIEQLSITFEKWGLILQDFVAKYLPLFIDYILNDVIPGLITFYEEVRDHLIPVLVDWYEYMTGDLSLSLGNLNKALGQVTVEGIAGMLQGTLDFVSGVAPFMETIALMQTLFWNIKLRIRDLITDGILALFGAVVGEGSEDFKEFVYTVLADLNAGLATITETIREDGLIAAWTGLRDILLEMVDTHFPSVQEAATMFVLNILIYMSELILVLIANWRDLTTYLKDTFEPTVADVHAILILLNDIIVILILSVLKIWEKFVAWLDISEKLEKHFGKFIRDTIEILNKALEDTFTKTSNNVTVFEDLKKAIESVVNYIASNWQSSMDKIAAGISSIGGALDSIIGKLSSLLDFLTNIKNGNWGFNFSVPEGSSGVPDTGGGGNGGGGSQSRTVNNFDNSRTYTLNSQTVAGESELFPQFASLDMRGI